MLQYIWTVQMYIYCRCESMNDLKVRGAILISMVDLWAQNANLWNSQLSQVPLFSQIWGVQDSV